jgi:hypothetical protein
MLRRTSTISLVLMQATRTIFVSMHRGKYFKTSVNWDNRRMPQIQGEYTTKCSQLGRICNATTDL